jgi:hypothetical protein
LVSGLAQVTLAWNMPGVTATEIHIGASNGPGAGTQLLRIT